MMGTETRGEDLIRHLALYTVLLSVDPRERWVDYESLFNKVLTSFEFVPGLLDKKG